MSYYYEPPGSYYFILAILKLSVWCGSYARLRSGLILFGLILPACSIATFCSPAAGMGGVAVS